MTKQILSAAVIATIAFAGCSQVSDTAKSATKAVTDTAKGATKAVTDGVSNAVDGNKSAADTKATSMKTNLKEESLKVGDVVETKVEMEKASVASAVGSASSSLPTSTSYTEQATTKVMEVADEKTDGKASQVVDALK